MMGITHALVGLVLGEVLMLNTPLVLLGAVIPDIDFLIGFEHRGITHSLLFLVTASLIVYKLRNKQAAFSLFMGLSSHLFLDSITTMGIRFLWPLNVFFSFKLTSSDYVLINLLIIILMAVAYYNKDSIIDYLMSLKHGKALKSSLLFIAGWSVLLMASPVMMCAGRESSINSIINEALEGESLITNGTICSSIDNYVSRTGNKYQLFYLCSGDSKIKVFKDEQVLENNLRMGDIIKLCGSYTTSYKEPEINYIKQVMKQ